MKRNRKRENGRCFVSYDIGVFVLKFLVQSRASAWNTQRDEANCLSLAVSGLLQHFLNSKSGTSNSILYNISY
jgi:hypothetical protein